MASTGLAPRAVAARLVMAACAVAIPLLMLAPYVSAAGRSASGWKIYDTKDILMLLAAVAIVALIGADLFMRPSRGLLGAAAAVAFVTLGLAWADFLGLPVSWDVAAYLVLIVALVECAAAVIALQGPIAARPTPNPLADSR
jgi:hypothetical protein